MPRKPLTADQQALLDTATELAVAARVKKAEQSAALDRRDEAIRAAYKAGVPEVHIAAAVVLERGAVYKIRNHRRAA